MTAINPSRRLAERPDYSEPKEKPKMNDNELYSLIWKYVCTGLVIATAVITAGIVYTTVHHDNIELAASQNRALEAKANAEKAMFDSIPRPAMVTGDHK